jgi:4-hydroxybenzoate polyprenyltransferase
MFGVLFMPGIFSRMVYDPSGSKDAISQFFVDANMALALLIFMIFALPVLWFLDRWFGAIPSKNQCYVMIFLSLGSSYLAGYIALGAPAMSVVLFLSALGVVTISVLKRHSWYVDDLWIFSFISPK